ncbi:hypothetical protein GCM10027079_04640 [Sediminivirga luteola]|uniref:Uncharacterized protein n=1 Tax=Sediminivirga luteola TaxID=1774748 RepID=A0A8J2TXA6_9MICO|nr:hypothetical protein GCM10011333_13620 [Sediminivirga luteola]
MTVVIGVVGLSLGGHAIEVVQGVGEDLRFHPSRRPLKTGKRIQRITTGGVAGRTSVPAGIAAGRTVFSAGAAVGPCSATLAAIVPCTATPAGTGAGCRHRTKLLVPVAMRGVRHGLTV